MKRTLVLVIFVLALAGLTGLAHAQSGGGYDLTWWTVDSGGGMSVGGGASNSYNLVGTAGQPDAGAAMNGGGYSLAGGFWGGPWIGVAGKQYNVYLPVVIK